MIKNNDIMVYFCLILSAHNNYSRDYAILKNFLVFVVFQIHNFLQPSEKRIAIQHQLLVHGNVNIDLCTPNTSTYRPFGS